MFGDGATNIGFFHEALNLSKVWKLPVLWVCENNKYGMGTSVERASAVSEIRQKAEGYNIPNERIEGMDVMNVYEAGKKAIEQVRTGEGPYFLEIVTYRYMGHSMGDPERYREKKEVEKWKEDDPIGIFRKKLISKKTATAKVLDDIEARAMQDAESAVQFAENSPEPAPEALWENVYVENNH
jgi:pyruvate dehydrogenase E1 component alpha subunit